MHLLRGAGLVCASPGLALPHASGPGFGGTPPPPPRDVNLSSPPSPLHDAGSLLILPCVCSRASSHFCSAQGTV